MKTDAIHPIIYVRGYAMNQSEIEDTVADPYMGFNLGSCKLRQLWDGQIKKFYFESPLVRLVKDYKYEDVYNEGLDQVSDSLAQKPSVPYRSIVIYRYYEPSSRDLGTGAKPDMERFAKGLSELILRLRDRMFPEGNEVSVEDRIAGKPASPDKFRVYLVSHSMGGLVCRAFLQNSAWGSDTARKLVDKVFTYATPHNGIDFTAIGNVPEWLSIYGINTFNRTEIAQMMVLPPPDGNGGRVDILTNFDPDKFFNLVGTDPGDYKVAMGLSSVAAGEASDGLVRIGNATTRGTKNGQIVRSPQAYVHRSHSGYFGIVNSEEGYQNLVRFLFGDVRVDGYLRINKLTLPSDVQKAIQPDRPDKPKKDVKASYLIEVTVSVRGKKWQLHRRVANDSSAIFRKYDDLFPSHDGNRKPADEQSPLLFTTFLDLGQRVDKSRPSVAFSADLCVRVPEYQVDGRLFLKNHFEGGYIFRDMVTVEAIPNSEGNWEIQYSFASNRDKPPVKASIKETDDTLSFEIPIVQSNDPGIDAKLEVITRTWNDWH